MARRQTSSLIVRMPFPAKALDSSAQRGRKKSRSTLWREKLKEENPDIYGELKKVDRQRKKREYHRELLDETRTTRYKRKLKREKAATQQRQRRRMQRLAKQSETTTKGFTTNDDKDNEMTKKERRNQYMKEYMRKERASLSRQKKEAVKEKDKQRKQLVTTKQSGTASTSSNGSMKDRKRKECQPCLPDTPERFADVIGSVLDTSTPKKIRALEERGIPATEEGRKGFNLMNRFGEETKELSESCKKKKKKKTSASKIVQRSLDQTIANIVRKKYGYANAKGGKHHS